MLPLILIVLWSSAITKAQDLKTESYAFGLPFNSTYYDKFAVDTPATISNKALQITPDSAGNFSLFNLSGRILYDKPFKLWDGEVNPTVASFNTSFLINIHRLNISVPGDGMTFVISPGLDLPPASDGQYLGLTNSTSDGNIGNHLIAIEFDTFKQDFDPDDNHIGLNINSVRSNKTTSLSKFNITLAPNENIFHVVWIQYDGRKKTLAVFMAEQQNVAESTPRPDTPVLTAESLDLSRIVSQYSYLGFSASTGEVAELHCVLSWNLTVEVFPGGRQSRVVLMAVILAAAAVAAVLIGMGLVFRYSRKRRMLANAKILGALKSLPGMPREFELKDLKRATNNFDDKNELGRGGCGVVYRGVLPCEYVEVAVKKFTRDDINSKDDFLFELTIINRLRQKHLVRLLGWCHNNGILLLVYEYMPNRSLDKHIFCEPEVTPLSWNFRFKILNGVGAALHYLHNEYDETVIHRDIKASNVMLDSNFNARLGDFGLARAIDHEKTSYTELDDGVVHGTMGYIAPEVFHTGRATRESDIYAFGAVLLEVACGQRPWTKISGFSCLVDWAWSLHREGRILEAVDERLRNDFVAEEAERVLLLGLACSHPIAAERPKTQAIVQILLGSVAPPSVPPFKPAFVWPAMEPVDTSLEVETDSTTIESANSESP
ncbi:hypothetical protein Nepgr_008467 [Nepenthes gracilis]|uniref:Protein kinase domain-containing protein n=1 Tax=Nepenthes gracilis TaxID=150966 RepID=A0AAD3XJ92_NEPGR|nr:hypothetical protein Nepgr_008467 [Nepenthes gracilis]